jgi:hypothetical protein
MVRSNTPKQDLVATCNAIITNLPAELGKGTVQADGETYTAAQLLAPLKAYVPLPPATANAKAAYSKAVDAEAAAKEAAVTMIEDVIKPYLQLKLGKSSTDLETYGLEPAKTPQKSAAVKAAAAQKGQATRKALGTKGPVQKKAAKKALEAQPANPAALPAPSTAPKS